jgi:cell division protein ZapA
MSEKKAETVKVNILESTYHFKCQPEEVTALQQAAQYLDQKLRYTKARFNKGRQSPALPLETALLLSALEISKEFLELKQSTAKDRQEAQLLIQLLQEKIDHVLEKALYQSKESDNVHAWPPSSQQK